MGAVTAPPAIDSQPDRSAGARRFLGAALLLELAVLAVTGVALFFVYRPSTGQAWTGVATTSDATVAAVRTVHRVASALAVTTAVAAVAIQAVTRTHGRWRSALVGAALVVTLLAASFTGYLLPFDQLALWAVTAGEDLSGYRPFFGDEVRFVLIRGTEVAATTIVRWLGVHSLLLTPLALGLVLALGRRRGGPPAI